MKLKAKVKLVTIREEEIIIDIHPLQQINAEALFRKAAREQFGAADRVEVDEMDCVQELAKVA